MITREEVIEWANSPVTKGLYELYKSERIKAEDDAFVATTNSISKGFLTMRTYDEVLQYARLEVANKNIVSIFIPLYENLEEIKKEPAESEESEKPKEDFISDFINNIKELRNAK